MRRLHRDIAALADGSYEAPGLSERVATEPELAALLHEQQRALAVTRAARPQAPPSLRAALASAPPRPTIQTPGRHNSRPLAGVAVAAAGVLALGVVAVLPSTAAPSVSAVATLAAQGPTAPPPPSDPAHPGAVRSALDGVRYPYWEDAFGWRASGTRADRLDGRRTMTVYYANAARATVDYTIVAGKPLPEPPGATAEQSHGVRFLGYSAGARTIVTWRRAGHTCVVAATRVPLAALLRLAEWRYDASPA